MLIDVINRNLKCMFSPAVKNVVLFHTSDWTSQIFKCWVSLQGERSCVMFVHCLIMKLLDE